MALIPSLGIQKINTTTLVMINNRIVYNDVFGGTLWDVLQVGIDDVDKIEVVRGPSAALYGPNAATGVINIITKKPYKQKGFHASTYSQAGSFSTRLASGSVSYGSEDEKFSFRLSGNLDQRDRHKTEYYVLPTPGTGAFGGGYRPDPTLQPDPTGGSGLFQNPIVHDQYPNFDLATDRYSIQGHGMWKTENLELNLLGGLSRSEIQRVYFINSFFPITTEKNESEFVQLFGASKALSFSADYSSNRNNTLEAFDFSFKIWNANVDYNIPLSDGLSLKPGLAFHWVEFISNQSSLIFSDQIVTIDDLSSLSMINGDGSSETNTITSGYARLEYYVGKFRFIGGARVDKFTHPNKYFFSPQVLTTYKPSNDVLLRASYGRSARAPFAANLFAKFKIDPPHIFAFLVSNEDQPDKLLTIDLVETGARVKLNDVLSAELELFYSSASNFESISTGFITTPLGGVPYFTYGISPMKVSQIGATLTLTAVPAPELRIVGFVTAQRTRVTNYDVPAKAQFDSSFTSDATPAAFGGLVINYMPTPKWNINLNSYFYGSQTQVLSGISSAQDEVSSNFILNAATSYEVIPGVKVFLNGRNLIGGNKRQYELSDQIKTSVMGGVVASF